MTTLNAIEELHNNFRTLREQEDFNDDFRLRIHRSISWLKQASGSNDLDMKFISLWIAFNAAYAKNLDNIESREHIALNEFLLRMDALDDERRIYNIIWKKFSHSIRLLLENKFVFQPFWDFHNEDISEKEYLMKEMQNREAIYSSLEDIKTGKLLTHLFSRLYTLRNQILHGGATYKSSVNRDQLRDACDILLSLLPVMVKIMMENHNEMNWGKPFYPLVTE